jgi:HTH-type transcriptional regulator/antitoxin MqsA
VEFAGDEGVRYAEALEKLRLKVDAEESAELMRIRKKLKLSQRRAAVIAGGGVNAFSRYENGKAKPVAAVVNLFRLLDKHPELINEIPA